MVLVHDNQDITDKKKMMYQYTIQYAYRKMTCTVTMKIALEFLLVSKQLAFSFQGITVPREQWYWPKIGVDEEIDEFKEEKEEEDEILELTVSFCC